MLLPNKKQSDVYRSSHDSRSSFEDGHYASWYHDIHLSHCIRIQQVHLRSFGRQNVTQAHAGWWSHGHCCHQHHVWIWPFHGVVLLMVGFERNPSGTADVVKGPFASALLACAVYHRRDEHLTHGCLQGFGGPCCARILTSWFATKERGTYWGMWNIAHNLGGFSAPILAGSAARSYGWKWGESTTQHCLLTSSSCIFVSHIHFKVLRQDQDCGFLQNSLLNFSANSHQ